MVLEFGGAAARLTLGVELRAVDHPVLLKELLSCVVPGRIENAFARRGIARVVAQTSALLLVVVELVAQRESILAALGTVDLHSFVDAFDVNGKRPELNLLALTIRALLLTCTQARVTADNGLALVAHPGLSRQLFANDANEGLGDAGLRQIFV